VEKVRPLRDPDPEVIDAARALLADAAAGRLACLALVAVAIDGTVVPQISGECNIADVALGLLILQNRIAHRADPDG
jgi:hypothetical protein